MRFDDVKSETLNLRVSPSFKLALKAVADNERRSMVNMLEVLLGDYCESRGIDSTRQVAPVTRSDKRVQPKVTAV
jgi:hypothetical protein